MFVDPMTDRLLDQMKRVRAWTRDEVEAASQFDPAAGELAEKLLRQLATGYLRPDPAFVLHSLFSVAMLRTTEMTEQDCLDADEDHVFINERAYLDRARVFLANLKIVLDEGPYAIAEKSWFGIAGMDLSKATKGATLPVITTSWSRIRGACAPILYADAVKAIRR